MYRPMAVAEPFARGHAQRHRLDAIAQDLGARLVRGSLADGGRPVAHGGHEHRRAAVLRRARGRHRRPQRTRARARLDVDARERRRDLWRPAARCRGGLHQARRVRDPGRRRLAAARLRARPDDRLGRAGHRHRRRADHDLHAGKRAAGDLRRRGHQGRCSRISTKSASRSGPAPTSPRRPTGSCVVEPGARPLDAERVVALPRAVGPALPGVLNDARGFIRCDRVRQGL